MKTAHDLVMQAKQQINELSTVQAEHALRAKPLLLDVREPDEYAAGHLADAVNVPRGVLEFRIAGLTSDPATPIVVYCKTSGRAALAAVALQSLGYREVYSIAGGYEQWLSDGLPVQPPVIQSFD